MQPSQYVRLYPGANWPSSRISSAFAWASFPNWKSFSHELMSSGALAFTRYIPSLMVCAYFRW